MRMFQTARHELHAQPDGRTGRLRHVTRLRTHRRFVAHALGACLFVLAGCGTTDEVAGDPAISVAARPSNPDAPTYATCQDLAKVFNARDENHLSYLRSVTMRFRSVNHSGSQFRRKRPLLDTTERNAGLRVRAVALPRMWIDADGVALSVALPGPSDPMSVEFRTGLDAVLSTESPAVSQIVEDKEALGERSRPSTADPVRRG